MCDCDYCKTYLTHDSSVQKILYSGISKENMKDYCQNRVEEQAQSLMDEATAAFQHESFLLLRSLPISSRGNDSTSPQVSWLLFAV
ncbi:hypothetical protein P7K49_025211, partial [Saguinus oedipus]